jgi:hypothetical protein
MVRQFTDRRFFLAGCQIPGRSPNALPACSRELRVF